MAQFDPNDPSTWDESNMQQQLNGGGTDPSSTPLDPMTGLSTPLGASAPPAGADVPSGDNGDQTVGGAGPSVGGDPQSTQTPWWGTLAPGTGSPLGPGGGEPIPTPYAPGGGVSTKVPWWDPAMGAAEPPPVPGPGGPSDPQITPGTGTTRPPANQAGPFDGSVGGVQSALQSAGWGANEDPAYWARRIGEAGGNTPQNLAYWQARIAAGPAAEQPGGAYYEDPNSSTGSGGFDSLLSSLFGNGNLVSQGNGPGGDVNTVMGGGGNVGQDPFSKLLTGGWASIIGGGGGPLTSFGQSMQNAIQEQINNPLSTGAFESARGGFQASHDGMMKQIMSDLADRGLVSTPGSGSGAQAGAENEMLRTLAPIFDQSIGNSMNSNYNSALNAGVQSSQNESTNMLNALNGGANYQQMVGNLALQTLKENDSFNEFAAQFGLNKDIAAYEIASGQNTQLLNMFAQFLGTLNTSANGTV